MFRVLLSLVAIESKAYILIVHDRLRTLSNKMIEFNSNILRFNEYVKHEVSELTARGETASAYLVSSLMDAYQKAEEPTFVQYIQLKESQFEDGMTPLSVDLLMNAAEAKYRTMVVKGTWQAPPAAMPAAAHDENFVALTTIIKKLTEQRGKGKGKDRDKDKDKQRFTGDWAWKGIAPTGDQPRTVTFRGKAYVACPNHPPAQWALAEGHAGGCRLDSKPAAVPTAAAAAAMPGKANGKTLSYVKALISVLDGGEEEGADEEDENV